MTGVGGSGSFRRPMAFSKRIAPWCRNGWLVLLFILCAAGPSWAAASAGSLEERVAALEAAARAAAPPAINPGDNAWMLVSSALVLMMTAPGLILFYGGLVRSKNVLGTMMHSLMLMARGVGAVGGVWLQHGLRGGQRVFRRTRCTYFFLRGVGGAPNPDYAATIPQQTFMLFQMMFAIITPALISGALGGAHEVQRLPALHGAVGDCRLFPAGAHGLGQGRPVQLGAGRQGPGARFCRRHGGAHQFRRFGPGLRAGPGQAHGLSPASPCLRTMWC